jgi:hypothetical protein
MAISLVIDPISMKKSVVPQSVRTSLHGCPVNGFMSDDLGRSQSWRQESIPSQPSWPSALCVFDRHSPSSNHQFPVSVHYSIDSSLPSQNLRSRNSPHKPNWPLNPRSYHPTTKSVTTNAKSEFHGKMERRAHCMLPCGLIPYDATWTLRLKFQMLME